MPDLRIGISGWTYAPWRGVFYPKGLSHRRELEFASRQFNTIEINGSFYSLQKPESYLRWYEATPEDFVFSVKGGRFITHMKKLSDVEPALANFFASGVLALGPKLGPILWQLPPRMEYDAVRIERFVRILPKDLRSAREIALSHSDWMRGRVWTEIRGNARIRHALEPRHESFRSKELLRTLRRHGISLVVSHSSGAWPMFEELTADFVYARLHGEGALYSGGYGDAQLDRWADRVRSWMRGPRPGDVYLYFDNDAKVRAPFDAISLRNRLVRARDGSRGKAAA